MLKVGEGEGLLVLAEKALAESAKGAGTPP